MATRRPNFVCFVTDQHRADHVGCYRNPDVATPNLDRLAREGMAFNNSFVANPVCMPNRASLFTGRYPKAHGLRENGMTLSHEERVLPELLRQEGYATASFGKIHLAPYGLSEERAEAPHDRYETRDFWEKGGELPLPYYGFEQVYLTTGHGPYCGGHYKREIEKRSPGSARKLLHENALRPPTGARESWKAAIPEELHYNTLIADHAVDFLEQRGVDQPFFAWCSFPDPHHPYSPPAPYCDQYDPDSLTFSPACRETEFDDLPPYFKECRAGKRLVGGLRGDVRTVTEAHYREILAHTYGMISMVDANVGRVLDALERRGLMDNTVIVFLSDHGDLMGDHWLINKGPFLYRGLVRVPTIWRVPGKRPGGESASAMVSAVDVCPTVLDLAGVSIPEGVQGRSYRQVLEGCEGAHRDWAYIEYDESYLSDRLRQIRSDEWAMTYYAGHDYGLLFDLQKDPDELHNRWDDPAYTDVKAELLAEMLRQTSSADDWLPEKRCHA